MDRRKFIKAGLFTTSALALGNYSNHYPFLSSSLSSNYDLVAIKGGEPEAMFDKAIASLGGMKNFVKKNQKVVIKPNIGWDVKPELAANTNPKLVARIIKHCFDAGAKDVYVFDHTCDNWNRCYTNSGIEKAVKDAGGKIVSGDSESYYQQVDVKKGKRLKGSKVHELILESDVFINVPILKHHGGGRITVGMKNLMGVVWDRRYWHQNDLQQCIADFATFKKPDLNIVDAYVVMKRNGPRGVSEDDLITLKSQIISTDIVAADSAAAKLFGIELADVPYINYADELKVGRKDLSKLNINRIIL
ncbi:MAG: DUF362 domain-containing protein [Ignavibacteriaceae bacterium]|jgi:uncharacterized protein (DUF362 family)|nr:DUF362 domain-containing protein [Ignavibacteriaceae bacterium]